MKDWKGNKTSTITTGGFRNNSTHERERHDYYATDPIALEKLLQQDIKFKNVWECACGEGNLSEVLKKYGIHGRSSDLIDRGYGEVINFLTYRSKWEGDIITNPPYKYATEFACKALEIIPKGFKVAFFLPQRYLSSKGRYYLFTQTPPEFVYAFSGRVRCALNNNWEKYSSNAVDYMWVIWEKGYFGETILRWIL
jgi:hypothetical protein